MEEFNKAQVLVDVVTSQRNSALNQVVEITAQNMQLIDLLNKSMNEINELREKVAEQEKQINSNVRQTKPKREAK